jgi:hypothetical protein
MSTYTAFTAYQGQVLPHYMMAPQYQYWYAAQRPYFPQSVKAAPLPVDAMPSGPRYSHNPYAPNELTPVPIIISLTSAAPQPQAEGPEVRRIHRKSPRIFTPAAAATADRVFDAESIDSDSNCPIEANKLKVEDSGSAYGVSDNESFMTVSSQRSPNHTNLPSQRISDTASTVSDESQTQACPPVSAPTTPRVQVFRNELKRVLHFVEFPSESLPPLPKFPRELKNDSLSLFFGQVGFNMNPELLCWLIETLTSGRVRPVHAFNCAWSCFVVQFACEDDLRMLLSWSDCVIFDRTGVWIAKTLEQKRSLEEYCERVQNGSSLKGGRLPKHAMVIRK